MYCPPILWLRGRNIYDILEEIIIIVHTCVNITHSDNLKVIRHDTSGGFCSYTNQRALSEISKTVVDIPVHFPLRRLGT